LSFKEFSKQEILSSLPKNDKGAAAFLAAVTKCSGIITGTGRRQALNIQLDSREQAESVSGLIKWLYPTQIEICEDDELFSGVQRRVFNVCFPRGMSKQILYDFEIIFETDTGIIDFTHCVPQQLIKDDESRTEYFKGLYFSAGSIYVPEFDAQKKQSYHFEMDFEDGDFADSVMELMSDLGINSKMTDSGEKKRIYVKSKDEILKILCVLGLVESAAKLRGIIDERETANAINRTVHLETLNMDKTFAAASRTILAITKLRSSGVFDSLPQVLKEAADARMQYAEASLSELAEILGIGKSCLRHRLAKIEEIADLG